MAFFTSLAASLGAYLATLGISSALATVAANLIVGIGTQLVASVLFRPKQPSAPSTKYQAVINQSAAERTRSYGWAKLGGPRAFWDQKDGKLYQIILLSTGRISSIERIWIGDKKVSLDAAGNVTTEPFVGYVQISTRMGNQDAVAYEAMVQAWPIKWSAEHRLRGIANAFVRFQSPPLEDLQTIFPESYNTSVTIEVKASEVYDPRTGLTGWNDNAGLCIGDYLTAADGFQGIDRDDIDWDSVGAFASTCGQIVDKKDGTTERRYRLWGTYSLEDEGKAVLDRMTKTCDAELYLTSEGRIGLRGGTWTPPTVVIDESMIVSYADLVEGADRMVAFNEVRITYVDPKQDYQTAEPDPWVDDADQARRGRIVTDFDVDMCPSPSQARRLAKIHYHKQNPKWQGSITTNLLGLNAINERTVTVRIPELSIDMPFMVDGWGINIDGGKPVGATFQIRSLTPTAYAWDPATEEGTAPADVEDDDAEEAEAHPDRLPVPVRAGAVSYNSQGCAIVSFVPPEGRPDLRITGKIRSGGDSDWLSMSRDGYRLISPPLAGGTSYVILARWSDAGSAFGPWTDNIPAHT